MNFNKIKKAAKNVINSVVYDFKEDPETALLAAALGLSIADYVLVIVFGVHDTIRMDKLAVATKSCMRNITLTDYEMAQIKLCVNSLVDKVGETDPKWMNALDAELEALRQGMDPGVNESFKLINKLKL